MAFTYFLRDFPTLELAVKQVLPYVAGRSHVRVWDAGCAMGQEPYSLAMVFAESMGYFAFKNLKIHASDIDDCETFGEIVRAGVYQEEEVKRMPADLLNKYFQPATGPVITGSGKSCGAGSISSGTICSPSNPSATDSA